MECINDPKLQNEIIKMMFNLCSYFFIILILVALFINEDFHM